MASSQATDYPQVPDNCLVIECSGEYRVEFEGEATRVGADDVEAITFDGGTKGGYRIWISLFNTDGLCSSSSVVVPSLDQFTIKGVAIGYAEGWDQG